MEIESNNTVLRFKEQGNAAYKQQDYQKAISYYSMAIKEYPSDPSFYSNRCLCYFNFGRLPQALSDCETALALQPNSAKLLRKKYQICILLLRFEQAEIAAKALVASERSQAARNQLEQVESLRSNYERMIKAEKSRDYQQALSCSTYLANKIAANSELKLQRAEFLLKTGRIDEASGIVNAFTQTSSELSYLHGLLALYSGDSEKAIRCFVEGLRQDPENTKYKETLKRAKRCEACKAEGNELARRQRWRDAVERYTQAIALDPYNKKLNSVIYSNRGLAFSKLGEQIKALEDFNKSLELEPDYLKSLLRRAEISMKREDYSAALNDFVRAQQLDPSASLKEKIDEARRREKAAKKKDYYAILGIARGASEAEIKKAYKALALKYHPDRNRAKSEVEQQEAARKFKDIAEAHTVLTDPEKKKLYDCGDIQYDGDQGGHNFGGGGDFSSHAKFSFNGREMPEMDPTKIFQMFFNSKGSQQFAEFQGFDIFDGERGGFRSRGFPGFEGAKGFQGFGYS